MEAESTVHVLQLDDEPSFLRASKRLLERHGDIRVETETDPEAALDALGSVDCIVSDYEMHEMDGIEFLESVRQRHPHLPFILFTGKGSEEIAAEAISAGVTDYLQKGTDADRFAVLANRITNAVERYRAEKRATAADRRVRRVYERIDDAFVAIGSDWQYTYMNQQAAELLERDADELLGETVWESFPETQDTRFETELRRSFEEQETVTFEEYYEPLDRWFEVRTFPDEAGLSVYFRDVTDQKQRERRYDAIFNNTYQFTGLLEPDGTLIEANETALEFVGADREEVVGEPLWETPWFQFNGETRRIARRSVQQARAGTFYRDEFPIEGVDGETIIIDYSVRPVTDEQGEVTLLVPEGRDITDRKQQEAELREERAFTESIFSALPDVFYAFDESGKFIRWNDRFASVTGYSDEEITEMEPTEFVPEDERDRIERAIREVFEEGRTITIESAFLTKDGERIPYEFTGAQLTDDSGQTLGLVGIGRDIRDRKERERRFEAVFNNTYQFTGLLEPDGTLIEANETALAFGGIDRDDVVGKPVWETHWFQESEETRRTAEEAVERAADGEFFREEIAVKGAGGETAIIDFSVKPVYDERGEVTLLIPEGRNITELKEREQQLERKNEQLEEFASLISHDLKTPLSVASGNLQLARETGDEAFLDEIDDALDRMETLIDEVLELAKQGDIVDDPERVRLGPMLSNIETATGATLETDFPEETTVLAEESRIYSLLSNLVGNAVEHGGPDVTVEVGVDDDTLYVADDGEGIPDEKRDAIFEPGYSGDDGTGFGLAIVRAVADAHGWSVSVTDSDAGGARFEVSGVDVQCHE